MATVKVTVKSNTPSTLVINTDTLLANDVNKALVAYVSATPLKAGDEVKVEEK